MRRDLSVGNPIWSGSVGEIRLAEQRLARAGNWIVVEGLLRPM
jgi:hypothetical protein